jgi:hypothetical protein
MRQMHPTFRERVLTGEPLLLSSALSQLVLSAHLLNPRSIEHPKQIAPSVSRKELYIYIYEVCSLRGVYVAKNEIKFAVQEQLKTIVIALSLRSKLERRIETRDEGIH